MCTSEDKETGRVAFTFNVGEVKVTKNPKQDKGWKTWQWGETAKEEKVNISDAYKACIMINNDNNNEKGKDDHKEEVIVNQYQELDESGSGKSSIESDDEEEYEFMIPEG
jgi:hypothetical protein